MEDNLITYYHGSSSANRPVLLSGFNAKLRGYPFDGVFANITMDAAKSHGDFIHEYAFLADEIASSSDLDQFDKVKDVLARDVG